MANPLDFSRFRVVVVTGPQRSGTTIAARIIATESSMQFVDEDEYGTKDVGAWKELVATGQQLVVHSPAMARWVHEVANPDSGGQDVAVVWLIRPLLEILASQQRVGWDGADERIKYEMKGADGRPVAVVKTWYWYHQQRPFICNPFEIEYHDLERHRLWVPAHKRVTFGKRQWQEYGNE